MPLIKATFENLLHPGSFIRILFHSILFFSKSMQSLNTQMLPQDLCPFAVSLLYCPRAALHLPSR